MKKKSKDKQAAKLKELRKSVNSQNHIALVITKAVEYEFNRMGVDNLWGKLDSYRSLHKHDWYDRCFLPYGCAENALFGGEDTNMERSIDLSNIGGFVDHLIKTTGTQINRDETIRDIWESEWTEAKYLLPIVAAWRQYKEIFKFDKEFLDNLLLDVDAVYTAGIKNILTLYELETLPFPAFYVDAPLESSLGSISGFFFSYNQLRGHDGEDVLIFFFVRTEGTQHYERLLPISLLLQTSNLVHVTYDLHDEDPDASIWDCYRRDCDIVGYEGLTEEEKEQGYEKEKEFFPLLFYALQIVTYLASRFADVSMTF